MVGKTDCSMCRISNSKMFHYREIISGDSDQILQMCGISNAMDGTEDDLLWDTDDVDEEIEAPSKEWDSYDELLNDESEDVLEELFALDDECEDFAGF